MKLKNLIDPKKTALLVIDIQNDYCSEKGKIAKLRKLDINPVKKNIPKLIEFTETAKNFNLPIIFTRMIEDPKYMKQNAKIKIKSSKVPISLCSPKTWGFEYYKIRPKKGDIKIIKKSYDAFSNPKLENFLKKRKIKNLIITGVYTAVCVDTTLRTGFTKGYNIIVPKDLVSMVKEKLYQHNAAIDVWSTIFAHVANSKDIVKIWKKEF